LVDHALGIHYTLIHSPGALSGPTTEIKVYGPTIKAFSATSKNLTSLDVSACTELTDLYCSDNQLVALDVSNNAKLAYLNCSNNRLTHLDASNNLKLKSLSCESNQLTTLDVSSCTELIYLDCYDNRLTSLDGLDNTKIANLNCRNNFLNFSSLPLFNYSHGSYSYSPQGKLNIAPVKNAVDLSDQLSANDMYGFRRITKYTWKTTGGSTLVEGTDFTAEDGVFTFLKIPDIDIYCEMTNVAFTGLTLVTEHIDPSSFIFDCELSIPENVVVTRNGSVLKESDIVQTGDELVITATPPAGYNLALLNVNGMTFTNGETFTVRDNDLVIEATFIAINYTLTFPEQVTVKRNDIAISASDAVNIGDRLVISATPSTGYVLISLTVNGSDFTNNHAFTVGAEDVVIEAVFELSTSVNNPLAIEVVVYPNPFKNKLYIDDPIGLVILKLELVDVLGNVLIIPNNAREINTEELKCDFYLLRITTSKGVVVKKLIKH
jgi:hypothetical protein